DLFTISKAALKLGSTPVDLTGSINAKANPADLNLTLKSGDISIGEIARLASAFGVAFSPGTDVAGRISGLVQVRGTTAKPMLTGNLAGRDLRITGGGIAQPVEAKAVDVSLSPNEIHSNTFEVRSGKTAMTARFGLEQYSSPSPIADITLKAA